MAKSHGVVFDKNILPASDNDSGGIGAADNSGIDDRVAGDTAIASIVEEDGLPGIPTSRERLAEHFPLPIGGAQRQRIATGGAGWNSARTRSSRPVPDGCWVHLASAICLENAALPGFPQPE